MSKADAGRLIHIAKNRERAKEAIEQRRKKIEEETNSLKTGITSKFTANYDAVEESLKSSTVGLVTLDEMREKQKDVVEMRETQIATDAKGKLPAKPKKAHQRDAKASQKRVLSFAFEDEEEDDEKDANISLPHKKRVGMDPTVDTAFLPDRERENELAKLKEDLAKEWQALQEKEKNEEINVAFAYWDGSSHRKDLRMKKGNTISQFLARALEILKREFSELRPAVPENLMFVKEDLIIPHFYTFQDFIATKAMGKTGPLYEFDAAGEIRLRQDAAIDCGESHPVKVVLRSWYEKNKHIYPASRWEAFVPNVPHLHMFFCLDILWMPACAQTMVAVVLRSWYEKNKHIYPASRWEAFVPNKEYRRTIDDLTTI
ncbi:Protein FAM50 -like protein [Toxocara canis]|uniref:Protein FAM50 homolog n=1 Tax=Toxocara canis TaxID=6265 RepID=A0A0B2VI29_TOXCA|nr:Protein FAM50 -like protein [Toxocara canis]